jgi:hypothetical protein
MYEDDPEELVHDILTEEILPLFTNGAAASRYALLRLAFIAVKLPP